MHIINYSAKTLGRRQWVSLPGLKPDTSVQQLAPGAPPCALETRSVKGRQRIDFPNDRIYSLIRVA